jgi:hypothetical protein
MNYELRLSSEAEHCIENQLQWYETEATNGGEELTVVQVRHEKRPLLAEGGT